jgi:hypothetical protein
MSREWILTYCWLFASQSVTAAQEPNQAEASNKLQKQHRNGSLRLTKAERQAADIIIAKIEKRALTEEITAPGKIALDTNRAAQATVHSESAVVPA